VTCDESFGARNVSEIAALSPYLFFTLTDGNSAQRYDARIYLGTSSAYIDDISVVQLNGIGMPIHFVSNARPASLYIGSFGFHDAGWSLFSDNRDLTVHAGCFGDGETTGAVQVTSTVKLVVRRSFPLQSAYKSGTYRSGLTANDFYSLVQARLPLRDVTFTDGAILPLKSDTFAD
jgi:hypothetical protein